MVTEVISSDAVGRSNQVTTPEVGQITQEQETPPQQGLGASKEVVGVQLHPRDRPG